MTVREWKLLHDLRATKDAEIVTPLLAASGVRLERIVSYGQCSPAGFWYDQAEAEWVMVLSGAARLAIESESGERAMGPGDAIHLPARCRHRVTWTTPDEPTVWLVLFLDAGLGPTSQS